LALLLFDLVLRRYFFTISQERAGRLVSATSVANMIPNRALSRQTMVNRRASIGVFSFDGSDYAKLRLNGF